MSRMLYTVTSDDILFDGAHDLEYTHKDGYCRYEGTDRKKSLDLAMNEGATFWTESKIDDPEMKLMYRIFQNRSL